MTHSQFFQEVHSGVFIYYLFKAFILILTMLPHARFPLKRQCITCLGLKRIPDLFNILFLTVLKWSPYVRVSMKNNIKGSDWAYPFYHSLADHFLFFENLRINHWDESSNTRFPRLNLEKTDILCWVFVLIFSFPIWCCLFLKQLFNHCKEFPWVS